MDRKALLEKAFLGGRVSRRDFVAGMAAFGVSAAAAEHMADGLIARAEADEPKSGGHIKVATADGSASDMLDPQLLGNNFTEIVLGYQIYSRPIEFIPGEGLRPALIETWEPNADATEWHFTVRRDVEFHNGKTLDSGDLVYSLNRVRDPELASPSNAIVQNIADVVTDGPDAFTVRMSEPYADLPYLLCTRHFMPIAADNADPKANPIGTGPWMVKEWEPGLVLVTERNPNYWRDGRPYVDSIETFTIPDDGARVNGLIAGDADMVMNVNPTFVQQIEDNSGTEVMMVAGAAHATFPMRADTAPFDNPDVRTALKYAFDRERFRQLAFSGYGGIGRDNPVPEYDPFFCADVPVPAYDPDLAKSLLSKAGLENHAFELHTSDANYGGANAGVVLGELMREAGLNVSVKKTPADGYWSAVWMQVPWSASSWTGRPTGGMMMSYAYTTGVPYNEAYWSDPRLDAILREAGASTDEALRRELYCEAQMMISTQGSSIIPIFVPWIDGKATKIKGIAPHPLDALSSGYWDEMWIDDSAA